MANINLDFSDMSDPALASLGGNILADMALAVAIYATPTPTLAVVQTALDDFITAHNNSQGGSYAQKAAKNDKREALEKLLKKLGNYVKLTADGDHTKLVASGFPMSKVKGARGPLGKAVLSVKAGAGSGTVDLRAGAIPGADTYQFEYTTTPVTPQSEWTVTTHTRSKLQLTGLPSGTQHAFRVVAIGADPSRTYSDIITSYVL